MLKVFFSSAAHKAWVAGVLPLLLTPLYDLLRSDAELSWRTALVALISGAISAAAVFGVTNKPPGPISEVDLAEAEMDEAKPYPPPVVDPFPKTTDMRTLRPPWEDDPPGQHAADR